VSGGRVLVVGGGYSGTLLAIQLVRRGTAITLVERADRLARGIAFSTRRPEHLLNVRAGSMSALAEAPADFAQWFEARSGGAPAAFAQRRLYGAYLEAHLERARSEAGDRLETLAGEATDLREESGEQVLRLADGRELRGSAVVLAIGNLPPAAPPNIDPARLPAGVYAANPWASDIAEGLRDGDELLLVGTGLTAVDAALTLDGSGFRGRITSLSRRGLLPRSHGDPSIPVPPLDPPPPSRCTALTSAVRSWARDMDWRSAVDRLRPHTQSIWRAAETQEHRRFLRHLRPWWDVHRHRIAPEIGARMAELQQEGRLRVIAGKIVGTEAAGEGAEVRYRPRGRSEAETLAVRRIVNCTGPQLDISRAREPLLDSLIAAGRIRPDPCRIGIDVDADSRTLGSDGAPAARLYAVGPLTRAAWWEIVAVPDIKLQVAALAERLSA
jgi:uncharacterized NAD(P)/FAD-binding protein YdhS